MKKEWIVKTLALGVVVLFIGVSFQPVFAVESFEKETNNNNFDFEEAPGITANDELVEITTEFCGIQGAKPHTVKLTSQQAQELEFLLEDIRVNLEKVEAKDDVEEILKNAFLEFDEYGLLGNVKVKQIQELVLTYDIPFELIKPANKVSEINNSFCLVVGKSGFHTSVQSILISIMMVLIVPLALLSLIIFGWGKESPLIAMALLLAASADEYAGYLTETKIVLLFKDIWFFPGKGWIKTFGLLGRQDIEGTFVGIIPMPLMQTLADWYYSGKGISGFKGLKIKLNNEKDEIFFIGHARRAKIKEYL